MSLDRSRFVRNYLAETRENLGRIEDAAITLEKNPEQAGLLDQLLRSLHTVKGSSRMMGYRQLEKAAHALEDVCKGVGEERYPYGTALMQLLLLGSELIRKGLEGIEKQDKDTIDIQLLQESCRRAFDNEPYDEKMSQLRAQVHEPVAENSGDDDTQQSGAYDTIRISLADIDDIVASLNNVLIPQFQLKKFQKRIDELQEIDGDDALTSGFVSGLAPRDGSGRASQRSSQGKNRAVQEVRKHLQKYKKDFDEQLVQIERASFQLQEKIMRLSMLPVDLVLGELPTMVADTAAMLTKKIDVEISGREVLLDKLILEKLHDPLIHIVRNAVDHGIELPEVRERAGKSPRGQIRIDCTAEGGNSIIRIRDDGSGINRQQIVDQALRAGLVSADAVEELADAEVYAFIFEPGFSSREEVSEMSGRGVGLDIVRVNVESVKGRVSVSSTEGEGTVFTLSVPLSLATVSGFFVHAGGEKFLIPSTFVSRIVRIERSSVIEYMHKSAFRYGQEIIPLHSLSSLLGRGASRKGDQLYVAVVESMGERIGIIVDDVLQHVTLIYKPVPRNLRKLRAFQGVVFDDSYQIVSILFIPEIIKRFRRIKSIDLVVEDLAEHQKAPVILVVDDSENTRDIEASILEFNGYRVEKAKDGIEALNFLRNSSADLILTDIQMPRMDGVTMTENIRKNAEFGNIPIVAISMAGGEDERIDRAGVDARIDKSSFNRNRLLKIVQKLLEQKEREQNPTRQAEKESV